MSSMNSPYRHVELEDNKHAVIATRLKHLETWSARSENWGLAIGVIVVLLFSAQIVTWIRLASMQPSRDDCRSQIKSMALPMTSDRTLACDHPKQKMNVTDNTSQKLTIVCDCIN